MDIKNKEGQAHGWRKAKTNYHILRCQKVTYTWIKPYTLTVLQQLLIIEMIEIETQWKIKKIQDIV